MNDSLKPDWIRKKQSEQEAAARGEEMRQQRIVAASLLIERDGPKFWKELKEKLAVVVEFLPDLKLAGSITAISEDSIRVSVNKPGVFPSQTYTDLFYNLDNKEIRCSVLNGGVYNLHFCVTPDHVAVIQLQQDSKAMDPDAASQHVMEVMIRLVEAQS